ncbi:MAG: Cyclin-A2 [Paramarteilia canceri]
MVNSQQPQGKDSISLTGMSKEQNQNELKFYNENRARTGLQQISGNDSSIALSTCAIKEMSKDTFIEKGFIPDENTSDSACNTWNPIKDSHKSHLAPSKAFSSFQPLKTIANSTKELYDANLEFDPKPLYYQLSEKAAPKFYSEVPEHLYLTSSFFSDFLRQFMANGMPKPFFMTRQKDINASMRYKLVDWLMDVVDDLKMTRETLFLTISLIDRFLSKMAVVRGKLQLVGTASLLIASKFEEIYPPEVKVFSFITENSYSEKEVLEMESLILKTLGFQICVPNLRTFIQTIIELCCPSNHHTHQLTLLLDYLSDIVLLECDVFSHYPPALLAFALISTAFHLLQYEHPWPRNVSELAASSSISFSNLRNILVDLLDKYEQSQKNAESPVYRKYGAASYEAVSRIAIPKNLPLAHRLIS